MKLTKRIISLLMAMLMLCSGMAVTAFAENATEEVKLAEAVLNIEARTLELKKIVTAETWKVEFTTSPNTVAAPTLMTETEESFFYCNLEYGTTYTAKVTADEAIQSLEIKLLKQSKTPAAPVAKKITSSSIEIGNVSGCEYKISDSDWGDAVVFTKLTPNTAYTIEMRVKATETSYASAASSITVKTLKEADPEYIPAAPSLVNKTDTSLVLKEEKNVEFSIDGGKTWQENGTFSGLKADSTYSVIARYTFDAKEQDPNPSTLPVQFITNERANYFADLAKNKFSASNGDNYANETVSFTITIDVATSKYSAQYGDTKYVPAYYTIGDSTEPKSFSPSNDGKTFKASFIPGDENADKNLAIKVYYEKQMCYGEKDGEPDWRATGEVEVKTYRVKIGEVHTTLTDIKGFFLEIFNVLFNTIPAAINDMLKGFDLSGFMSVLNELLGALNSADLGGLVQ